MEKEVERKGQLMRERIMRERKIPIGAGAQGPRGGSTEPISAGRHTITTPDALAVNADGTNKQVRRDHDCKTCRLSYRERHSASTCCDPHNNRGRTFESVSDSAGGRVVWAQVEATYAEDMIQAENELLQHISETQLSETQPTEILRLAQEELAQLQE